MGKMLKLNGELINLDYVKTIRCSEDKCSVTIRNTESVYGSVWNGHDIVQTYTKTRSPESYAQLKGLVDRSRKLQ